MLQQLGDVKFCGLFGSCFSGLALEWFQGIGLSGTLVTTSNGTEVSYNDGNGHFVVNAFLDAKKNNPNLTDEQALQQVLTSVTSPFTFQESGVMVDRVRTSMPQYVTVNPNGVRKIEAPFIRIDGPGDSEALRVIRRRIMPNNQAFTVTIEIADKSIASGAKTLTVPAPLQMSATPIKGEDCGVTTYTLKTTIGGKQYEGTGVIQVGHFKPSTKHVRVVEGNEATVTLDLFGTVMMPVDRRIDASSSFVIGSMDKSIAVPDKESVDIPNRATQVSFKVKGLKAGMSTTFDVFLVRARARKTIKVTVLPKDNRQSLNFLQPFERAVSYTVATVRNRFNHPIRIPLLFGGALVFDGEFLWFQSDPIEVVDLRGEPETDMTGALLDPLVAFLSGNSGNDPIAGFSNVPANATVTIFDDSMFQEEDLSQEDLIQILQDAGDSGVQLAITYTLGDGVFPGGPIEWDIVATVAGTCGYSFDPAEIAMPSTGGQAQASLNTQDGCPWTASSQAPWLTVTSTASGAGAATISFTAAENTSGTARTGALTAGGATVTVTQDAAGGLRPSITGVVNGASFAGSVASASWITISGLNLAPTTRVWDGADFNGSNLPTALDGVSVTVNGRPAYVFFISPNQLNVLSPDDSFLGFVEVVVTTAHGASFPYQAYKDDLDPALFAFDPEGRRYAAAVHADGTFLTKDGLFPTLNTRAAKAGDPILLFGAGFGATNPAAPTAMLVGGAAPLNLPVVVRIGGEFAEVQFAGIVGSGLYQFNVVVPDLDPGDHEVEIFVGAVPIQRGVFIPVE